ncbi:MAG: PEPxxWA-CTERM sorting domain-containing protein [Sphingomonas sp.]
MRFISKALIGASLLSLTPTAANAATIFQLDIFGTPSNNTSNDKPRFLLSNLSTAGEDITGITINYTLLPGMPNAIIDVVDGFTSVGGTSPSVKVLTSAPTSSNGQGSTGLSITYKPGTFQVGDKSQFFAEFDLAGKNGTTIDFRKLLFSGNATGTVTFGNGETANFDLGTFGDKAVYTYTGGGAAGVPEPAAWGMMIGGFGFAGAALRNRKRAANRVAAA